MDHRRHSQEPTRRRAVRPGDWALVALATALALLVGSRLELPAYVGVALVLTTATVGALLMLRNSHRRSLEGARRESEARLHQLAANAGDIIYRYRVRPPIACEYINPAVTRITGYTPESCYADPLLPRRRVHHADAAHLKAIISSPRTGEPVAIRWRHRDGSERMLELLNIPIRDGSGELVAIEGVARDVTRVFEAEEQLRNTREMYRALGENSTDVIARFDASGCVLSVNPAITRYTGLPPAAIIGRSIRQLGDPGGMADEWEAEVAAVFADGRPRTGSFTVRGPQPRHFSYRLFPEFDRDGKVATVVTWTNDITDQRALEAQYQQAQKMEAVGRLAGGVAHDFNNLITAIKGYAAFLLKELPPDSAARADAAEIARAAERAAGLTRQLLAFSRRQVLELRVLRLDSIVRDMDLMLRRLIGEDITMVIEAEQGLWPIMADAAQVEQVLLNLVVNARDAMEWGGRLEIRLHNLVLTAADPDFDLQPPPGEYVALLVADCGTGMDTATRQRMYEPFFTTKEVGRGTGLGLPTVYGIVQQTGGGIRVQSVPGEGSIFEVLLPRARSVPETLVEPVAARRDAPGGERILLVEDESPVRALLLRMLEDAGYLVSVAANGTEALALTATAGNTYDLLLTDVIMPGMSGPDLAREFVARYPEARVLYTSGYSNEFIAHHGALEPGSALLQKPFTQETLEQAVRATLEEAAALW